MSTLAQNEVLRKFLGNSVQNIQINADNCYLIKVSASIGDTIVLTGQIDGEYTKDLQVESKQEGNALYIAAGFRPSFNNPNDKLSAHKVVSIALWISVPENKKLVVYGTNARVVIEGSYKDVSVVLADGDCELSNVLGSASVSTQSGGIIVNATKADIFTDVKYGKISENPIPKGGPKYQLKTVTGNIQLNKTE